MKIGIDCRFWGIRHTGLGRYTQELVMALIKQLEQDKWRLDNKAISLTLFFPKGIGCEDKNLLKNCQIIEVDIPHYSLKEQLFFGGVVDQEKLDLVHFPHFNIPFFLRTPFVVTIHDLIKHYFRGRSVTSRFLPFYWMKYFGYRLVVKRAVSQAKQILVPSNFVKTQLIRTYPKVSSKIRVTYEGVSQPYRQSPKTKLKDILAKYHLSSPFFIYTGNAYPFKDIPTLLKAFKQSNSNVPCQPPLDSARPARSGQAGHRTSKIQLIIVCARSVFWERLKEKVEEIGVEEGVRLPGEVPDKEVAVLYRQAVAFITPSLMEGFGLPGLEAMASGCPVIAARAGSLPEIYGKAAIYFEPQNPNHLVLKIGEILGLSSKERNKLVKLGTEQSQKYSWEKTARTTLTVYGKILAEANP